MHKLLKFDTKFADGWADLALNYEMVRNTNKSRDIYANILDKIEPINVKAAAGLLRLQLIDKGSDPKNICKLAKQVNSLASIALSKPCGYYDPRSCEELKTYVRGHVQGHLLAESKNKWKCKI